MKLQLSWSNYQAIAADKKADHWLTQMGPQATSCGADLVSGLNYLAWESFESAKKTHDAMVKDLKTGQADGFPRVYVIGYTTESKALAMLKRLGWKHLDSYRSCHGDHTVHTVAFSTTWKEKPKVEEEPQQQKKAEVQKDDGKGNHVVVKRHIKTPIAKAIGTVKMAVVKTKRAVTKTIRKSKEKA